MQVWVKVLGAALLGTSLAACDVDVEDEGELPDVDVSVEDGRLPEVDVETADVEIGTQEADVPVPDVDVDVDADVRKKRVKLPDVDVKMPDEPAENAADDADDVPN